MCGIAGIVGAQARATEATEAMVRAMHHRGPDGRGVRAIETAGGAVVLGHARLAVLDPGVAGAQPMRDAAGNWLVYNGEVYNHLALRAELERLGERFVSRTDSEVVLRALSRWGEAAVERFDGMFAFAWWCAAEAKLLVARDRLGLKPLYIARGQDDSIVFASEVRAILASGRVERTLDTDAFAQYLWNGFMVAPRTMVAGVRALGAGACAWIETDAAGSPGVTERRYWCLPRPSAEPLAPSEATERLRGAFDHAVSSRLQADVPLGAFLSGGLDSSAIVASMARAGADLHTFAIAFDEASYDESQHAALVAKRFGSAHREVRVTRESFFAWLPDAMNAFDQPSFDGLNSYFVSRAAAEAGVTVALSGLGADELFGGYPFFAAVPRMLRASRMIGAVPGRVRRWLGPGFDGDGIDQTRRGKLGDLIATSPVDIVRAYQLTNALFRQDAIERLLGRAMPRRFDGLPAPWRADDAEGDADSLTRLGLRLFLGDRCLRDTDQMSMASSLEVRAPFTDHRFVEAALAVDATVRTAGAPDKPFEVALFADRLPDAILRRKKRGFVFPLDRWLRGGLGRFAHDTLLDPALATRLSLDGDAITTWWDAFERGHPGVPWSRVWALTIAMHWCRTHDVRCASGSAVPCA